MQVLCHALQEAAGREGQTHREAEVPHPAADGQRNPPAWPHPELPVRTQPQPGRAGQGAQRDAATIHQRETIARRPVPQGIPCHWHVRGSTCRLPVLTVVGRGCSGQGEELTAVDNRLQEAEAAKRRWTSHATSRSKLARPASASALRDRHRAMAVSASAPGGISQANGAAMPKRSMSKLNVTSTADVGGQTAVTVNVWNAMSKRPGRVSPGVVQSSHGGDDVDDDGAKALDYAGDPTARANAEKQAALTAQARQNARAAAQARQAAQAAKRSKREAALEQARRCVLGVQMFPHVCREMLTLNAGGGAGAAAPVVLQRRNIHEHRGSRGSTHKRGAAVLFRCSSHEGRGCHSKPTRPR